jgi:hypothetical protein
MCDKLFTLTLDGDGTAEVSEACVACGDGCEDGADVEDEGTTWLVDGSVTREVEVECDCPLNRGLGGGA